MYPSLSLSLSVFARTCRNESFVFSKKCTTRNYLVGISSFPISRRYRRARADGPLTSGESFLRRLEEAIRAAKAAFVFKTSRRGENGWFTLKHVPITRSRWKRSKEKIDRAREEEKTREWERQRRKGRGEWRKKIGEGRNGKELNLSIGRLDFRTKEADSSP